MGADRDPTLGAEVGKGLVLVAVTVTGGDGFDGGDDVGLEDLPLLGVARLRRGLGSRV